ncbi:MAG: hypothetical protein FJX29_04825 [Alphaproteobacteria bacterium]|nr:hypothetical protein [Alphaproteobacteria bacterium]
MSDDREKTQQELAALENELKTTGMSRRKFLDRLKGIGLGLGAVAATGAAASAHTGSVDIKTTNPALGKILEENTESAQGEGEENAQTAQYYYRRFYRRYGRVYYRRYGRVFYRRYGRVYYRRFYRRW